MLFLCYTSIFRESLYQNIVNPSIAFSQTQRLDVSNCKIFQTVFLVPRCKSLYNSCLYNADTCPLQTVLLSLKMPISVYNSCLHNTDTFLLQKVLLTPNIPNVMQFLPLRCGQVPFYYRRFCGFQRF